MVLGGENKRVIQVNNPTWTAPAFKKVLGEQVRVRVRVRVSHNVSALTERLIIKNF